MLETFVVNRRIRNDKRKYVIIKRIAISIRVDKKEVEEVEVEVKVEVASLAATVLMHNTCQR